MFALSDAREYSFSQVPYLEREEILANFSSRDGSSFRENWLTTRAKTNIMKLNLHNLRAMLPHLGNFKATRKSRNEGFQIWSK